MKLEKLEVTGFGKLHDLTIDFSPRITVITGDNEAGKSTTVRSIRAALYGIDAGGQGRATEKSDWARYAPWTAGPYGLALTYALSDGRRIRIARRLDQREQTVQVHELGGSDITGDLRVGRTVAPAQFHFGINEAVFCTTAWLGEDGLRLGSSDAASQRADELQDAIERLADTGKGVSAAQALAQLRTAVDRVGSQRRLTSPLGRATERLRHLDVELTAARRRMAAIAHDEERLRQLDIAAEAAHLKRNECERAWLVGRLAALATQQQQLLDARAEVARLHTTVRDTSSAATFPIEDEERVLALSAELHHATAISGEAQSRWNAKENDLVAIDRRRADIAAGLDALGHAPTIDNDAVKHARLLEQQLAEEVGALKSIEDESAMDSRYAALRQEVAATGLGGLPLGSADRVASLVETVQQRARLRSPLPLVGMLATGAGAAIGLAGVLTHRAFLGMGIFAGSLLVTALLVSLRYIRDDMSRRAKQELNNLLPTWDMRNDGLAKLAERLPTVRALHVELARHEQLATLHRSKVEASYSRLRALSLACEEFVRDIGLTPPSTTAADDINRSTTLIDNMRTQLQSVATAVEIGQRRQQLTVENERLSEQAAELVALRADTERKAEELAAAEGQLLRVLGAAGIRSMTSTSDGIAAFRLRCAARRQHDEAALRLVEMQRLIAAIGTDEATIRRRTKELSSELHSRGGNELDVASAAPLDAQALQELDRAASHAERAATSASAQASELRARLGGMLDSLPAVADLEDERAACSAAKERALHQLEALRLATSALEGATRLTHRELAPRLARSVGTQLSLITSGRYRAVNIDTEHFAVSLLGDERPEFVPLEVVSQGTKDQVSLLLRLALSEVLSESGEPLPLFLDEPLVTSDPQRTDAFLQFLLSLSERHQVIVTTAHASLAHDLARMNDDATTTVYLPPPSAHDKMLSGSAYTRDHDAISENAEL